VHWWERTTGKELRRVKGTLVAASADRRWLAIRQGKDILLWDVAADKALRRLVLEDMSPANPDSDSLSGSFSADGNTLAVPDGNRIRILDTESGKERHSFSGHADDVVFVGFSADGRRLISAADRAVRIWDPHTGKELGHLPGHERSISSAALTPDRTA